MKDYLKEIIDNLDFKYISADQDTSKNKFYKFKKYIFYLYSLIKYNELRHFTFFENTVSKIKIKEFKEFANIMKNIEGMSTIANAWIINQIASNLGENQNYVNIGCWKGFSLIAGMIDTKCSVYGVDNFAWKEEGKKDFYKNFRKYSKSNHIFYEGDYLNFLKNWEKEKKFINFYFYDGPHTYKDQLQALELASQFFKSGTIILVDDTNWNEPRLATLEFISKTNKQYELLYDLKCNHAKHPTFWNGLIILKKL